MTGSSPAGTELAAARSWELVNPAALAGDEELLLPRLVTHIAHLEHQLYSNELRQQAAGDGGGGAGSFFAQLLKRAQHGLDAGVAYL